MLRKTFTLKAPLDQQTVPLDMFLTEVSHSFTKTASGTYIGNGTSSHKIVASFAPTFIIIYPTQDTARVVFPNVGNIAIAVLQNKGVTWVSTVGFINNGVISSQNDGFTVGSSISVNEPNTSYTYFMVG